MSDARTVAGMDRLPWLADEPPPTAKTGRVELAGWAVGAAVLLAGASYWIGANSADERFAPVHGPRPAATVPLPAARPVPAPQPQVMIAPAPQVEPIDARSVRVIGEPRRLKRVVANISPTPTPTLTPVPALTPPPVAGPAQPMAEQPINAEPLQPWPARVVEGASGRLVRIGAFSTTRQAKKGWWAIMRINPALQRLPAVVVPVQSLRDGRIYYRLQMGTTSHAHSEILCQRMRMIGQGCVVIGIGSGGGQ